MSLIKALKARAEIARLTQALGASRVLAPDLEAAVSIEELIDHLPEANRPKVAVVTQNERFDTRLILGLNAPLAILVELRAKPRADRHPAVRFSSLPSKRIPQANLRRIDHVHLVQICRQHNISSVIGTVDPWEQQCMTILFPEKSVLVTIDELQRGFTSTNAWCTSHQPRVRKEDFPWTSSATFDPQEVLAAAHKNRRWKIHTRPASGGNSAKAWATTQCSCGGTLSSGPEAQRQWQRDNQRPGNTFPRLKEGRTYCTDCQCEEDLPAHVIAECRRVKPHTSIPSY